MKQAYPLIIIIPVGPTCNLAFIEDTLISIHHYIKAGFKIIIADDSQKGTGLQISKIFPAIDIIPMRRRMGKLSGLYITLSLAFRYALEHYDFELLLRMDTDALIIGMEPEKQAFEYFAAHPRTGLAGQYPLDYNGDPWDVSWPAGQLRRLLHTKAYFKYPWTHLLLGARYYKARKHNYRRGESVFGGACFYSQQCLLDLYKEKLLPQYTFKNLRLEEDHLFSLLVKSIGYNLGSLSSDGGPMGCAWRGLPAAPEALVQSGKKITHSTRYWNNMKEEEIRDWFRMQRALPTTPSAPLFKNHQ